METAPHKKLYRVREGEMLMGVCNGVAKYFDLDVVLVRVGFVFFAAITHGGFILAYFIMAMLMPVEGAPAPAHDWRDKWRYTPPAPKTEAPPPAESQHEHHFHYRHEYRRRPSLIGELMQLLIFALVIWALYTYVPQTQPFFDAMWHALQQAAAWLSSKLAH